MVTCARHRRMFDGKGNRRCGRSANSLLSRFSRSGETLRISSWKLL
jgi:hypothetical protein